MAHNLPTTISKTAVRTALLESLQGEILALRASDRWAAYLDAQSRFHNYSPRNVMLISMQRPDASHVAGFHTWRQLNRTITKGERALSILAPLFSQSIEHDHDTPIGFRWVSVFDIAQTQGPALPSPVQLLSARVPAHLEPALSSVVQQIGFTLLYEQLPTGVNGECRWADRSIVIRADNPPLQRVKTIVHECAHALLHQHERSRALAEIEAESVAYIALKSWGLDAAPYSAGYVASWLDQGDDLHAVIERSLSAIQRASATILRGLEQQDLPSKRASSFAF